MDQSRIGAFIAQERKQKKLTQKELANKLKISEKTISKWECGKGLPEVSLMKPLCKELDITVTDLLNGEKTKKEERKEEGIFAYLKYITHKSRHQVFLLVLTLTFVILTVLYFLNSYSKITVYNLEGEGEKYSYTGGTLTKSNIYNIYSFGEIRPAFNADSQKENILMVAVKSEDRLIFAKSNHYDGMTITEKYGYNEYFDNEKLKNIDNWYIEVIYLEENVAKKDIIPIKNKVIMKNNKFLSLPTIPIGFGGKSKYRETKKEIFTKADKKITELGYKREYIDEYNKDLASYSKQIGKEKLNVIYGDYHKIFFYKYKINDNTNVNFNYQYNGNDEGSYVSFEDIKGIVGKDGLNYYFNYNSKTKKIEYTHVIGKDDKYLETEDYPEINNLPDICDSYINYKKEIYNVFTS